MSTITAGKARLSDLNAADKAKISRLAEEVLRLRNELAAAVVKRDSAEAKQSAAATQNAHPNSSASESDFEMGAALREAAASLAAADAAQRCVYQPLECSYPLLPIESLYIPFLSCVARRRAERRASDAVLALDEQRTKWRERERECARVLCAAEQRIEAQRVKIAEFEKVGRPAHTVFD